MDATPHERLEARMTDTSDVYIGAVWDKETYLKGVEQGLRGAICRPFTISAIVEEPGFPDFDVGSTITGICVAHTGGYWLAYYPQRDHFLCFWGEKPDHLSAPGIYGSPLGCWTA